MDDEIGMVEFGVKVDELLAVVVDRVVREVVSDVSVEVALFLWGADCCRHVAVIQVIDDDALVIGQGEAVVVVESDVPAVGGNLSAVGAAAVEENEDDKNDDEDVVMMAALDVEEELVRESQALEVEKEVTSVDLSAAVELGMTVDLGFAVRVANGPVFDGFVAGPGLAAFERWDLCYVSLGTKDRGFGGSVVGTLDYVGSEELELVVRGFGTQNLGFDDVVADGLGFGEGAVEVVGRFGGFVEVDPNFVDEAMVDDLADAEATIAVETGIPPQILNDPVRPARQRMEKWRRCPVSLSVKSVFAPLIKGTQYAG